MNDLQKDFLKQSIKDLEALNKQLNAADVSENVLRDAFRTLHTIKGAAQVFGFADIGNPAHELENLLQAGREKIIPIDEIFHALLGEGFKYLTESFRQKQAGKEFDFPKLFVDKIRLIAKNDEYVKDFSFHLPPEILQQLSTSEKKTIGVAIESGRNLFLIETGFRTENLENEFKNFKNVLDGAGEIAAFFPSFNPAFNLSRKIGFRVFFITEKLSAEVLQMILPFEGEISFKIENDSAIFGDVLDSILLQAIDGAKKLAKQSGKQIEFDASLIEAEIPVKHLKILFDVLLHLTRNSIDHGIESKGKISIRLFFKENGLHLTVADNGKGIDIEKVRAKAIEKKLIPHAARLTKNETLNLIFAHGFSTSETISKTSGRGVGLDAVKDLVEKARGKITVKSEKNIGTTFEIFLPSEQQKADRSN
jgi:two-component system chemotaxis sensor kinase CheA